MSESLWPDEFYTYVIFTSKKLEQNILDNVLSTIQPEQTETHRIRFIAAVVEALPTKIADLRPSSFSDLKVSLPHRESIDPGTTPVYPDVDLNKKEDK